MHAFARLLDQLAFTPSRNAKLVLLRDYLSHAPDPERGWALASLTGALSFDAAKPAFIRKAAEARMDPLLFSLSYDFVGDLAETVALVWPAKPGANRELELPEVVDALRTASRREVPQLLERWLDALDSNGRWALLKLLTGGLRVGVSARLAKQALANLGDVPVADIEEVWHAQEPPYGDLFAWLEKRSERPSANAPARFRPSCWRRRLMRRWISHATPPRIMPPNGNGTASGCRPQRARRAPALQPHRRGYRPRLSRCDGGTGLRGRH